MGTKGSYTGGGGAAGRDLRTEVDSWPDTPPEQRPNADRPPDSSQLPSESPRPPGSLLPVIGLFRPRTGGGGDGPGGMGGGRAPGGGRPTGRSPGAGGGAQRSATRSASTAGRAAAAAYALRTGDAATLGQLGLVYAELQALDDPIEVTRRIVAAACGPLSDGTIEDDERRLVAAEISEWVLQQNQEGAPPEPADIVREAIALIIFEAVTNETVARIRQGDRTVAVTRETQRQIRETAQALAERADLSPTGATPAEFERAVEEGIETLRAIWIDGDA